MKLTKTILFSLLLIANHTAFAETNQSNFGGFYAGASVGAVSADSKYAEIMDGEKTGYTAKIKPEGLKAGGFVGFNYVTTKNILLGIEATYNFYGANGEDFEKNDGIVDTDYTVETNIEQSAELKARLGYIFNNNQTLGFLTAGYVAGKIETKYMSADGFGFYAPSGSDSQWQDGYLLGVGIEHFVTQNITARVEYNYIDFSTETYRESIYGSDYRNNIDMHSTQISVMYHF